MTDALPFALPDLGEDEINAVVDAIRTGWVSSGPKVREFEEAFSSYLGGEVEAVAINSATAGLHLALEALNVGPGDEVLVPTWTFTATAEVVRYLGAKPVLVDVESHSLSIDLEDAARRVTERTRCVIPVHFAGSPIDPTALGDFAKGHAIQVVEDAAHAFPARTPEGFVGAGSSSATVFSFYATKTITTGEGGMVVTRDVELAKRARVMRLHGIDRDAYARYRSEVPAWRYDVVDAGFKYNLTDPAAAMGLVQLARAEEMRAKREAIASRYGEAFAELPLGLPDKGAADSTHAWHLYVIRVPETVDRDQFVNELARRGIGTSVHFIPLHQHSYWRGLCHQPASQFPVAEHEFRRVVSLPIYSSMSDDAIERTIRAVIEVACS